MSEEIGDEQNYSGTMKTNNGCLQEVKRSKVVIAFVETDNQIHDVYS